MRNLMKICPVGAELFHVVRRTDVTKLIVAFYNYANPSTKKCSETLKQVISINSSVSSSSIHIHINTLCGRNVGFVNVKPSGTYSNHWAYSTSHFTLGSFVLS
jgi:hypothetical protein